MIDEIPSDVRGQPPPPALWWFKVYTGVMTGIYVLCMLAAPLLLWIGTRARSEDRVAFLIEAPVLFVVGLVLAIGFALPFFLPRKPWVWIYNLVLICIGMTSCCILPAAIPLLIYWIKPEMKAWFGRT